MTLIITGVLLIATLALGGWAFMRVLDSTGGVRPGSLIGSVALAVLTVLSVGLIQIEAGHIGVVRSFGAVTGQVLNPGIAWVPPFIASVDDIDTRVRQIRIENYAAASKEQQDLFMNLTLNYHVDPAEAPTIVQTIGTDFEAKVVLPRFLDIPKSVTDDYPTTTVLNSRDEIRAKAIELLRGELGRFGFVVDGLSLENFGYSVEYNASIEAKQIAQQQVETERQKLAQQEIIAQQRVAEAHGLAEAQIERARGEAESNRLVAASLTDAILLNRYIEKLVPGIQTILVPGGQDFLLDLKGVLRQPETVAP